MKKVKVEVERGPGAKMDCLQIKARTKGLTSLDGNQMRIGIFTDTYAPQINGVVTSIRTFTRALEARGHVASIFCPRVRGEPFQQDGTYRFRSFTFPFHREYRVSLPNPLSIIRQVRDLSLDLIHTHTPFALGIWGARLARHLDLPLVHTYHTFYSQYVHYVPFIPPAQAKSLAVKMSRGYCNLCDLVITPSEEMKDILLSYGVTRPIRAVPTGIDLESIHVHNPSLMRGRFHIAPTAPLLLYVGRVGKEKGLDFLFRSFVLILKERPEARLLISGGGTEKEHMVGYAQSLGLGSAIAFTGYLERQELFDLYAAADLFVFSSLTETQGLVLLEAMAVGTPVVAVRAMGVSEALQGQQGGLLTSPSEPEFSQAVLLMLRDPQLRHRKSQEARQRAEDSSAQKMAGELEGEYQRLLQERRWARRIR